jgi:DNA-binding GntR family transcriptional regulator
MVQLLKPPRKNRPLQIVNPLNAETPSGFADRAYRAILEQILRGQLPLGAPVSRRQVARELGMSVLPVSEALQRLEEEGLVESRPQVGTRVRVPTEIDLRDRFIVREALESQSARLFTERASVSERRELQKAAQGLDDLFYEHDRGNSDAQFTYALHRDHLAFHMRVAEGSGSPALCRLITKNDVLVLNWLFDLVGEQPPHPTRFHRDLAEALAGTDIEAAEQAMRTHVRYGLEATVQGVKKIALRLETSWRLSRGSSGAK